MHLYYEIANTKRLDFIYNIFIQINYYEKKYLNGDWNIIDLINLISRHKNISLTSNIIQIRFNAVIIYKNAKLIKKIKVNVNL